MHNITLGIFWNVDLTREWLPFIACSDAAQSYGYGLSTCRLDVNIVREVANVGAKGVSPLIIGGDPQVSEARGDSFMLGKSLNDFKTIYSIKAPQRTHAVTMEGRGALLALLRLTRTARHHRSKLLLGLDAQSILLGLRKGRSSGRETRRLIAAAAAVCMAADLQVNYIYVPSACNPADAPSRGARMPARRRQRYIRKVRHREKCEDQTYNRLRHALSVRGLLSDLSDNSRGWSTLGNQGFN